MGRKKAETSGDEWVRGFAACAATVARDYGEPHFATMLLRDNGLSLDDLRGAGVEEFDLGPLERAGKEEG